MPVAYEIDKERRLVVCTATGFCDILQLRQQLANDGDFDPSFSQLVDATGVTETDITPSQIRILAVSSPFLHTSRRALVAQSQLNFGLSRVYEIVRSLKGDGQICVFRDRAAALEWLLMTGAVA